MILRPPRSTLTDALCAYTARIRSQVEGLDAEDFHPYGVHGADHRSADQQRENDEQRRPDAFPERAALLAAGLALRPVPTAGQQLPQARRQTDRKSTRLNSSH